MIRLPALLIVTALAAAPIWDAGLCIARCASSAHAAAGAEDCHTTAQDARTMASAAERRCGGGIGAATFLREEPRKGTGSSMLTLSEIDPAAPSRVLPVMLRPALVAHHPPPAFTTVLRI